MKNHEHFMRIAIEDAKTALSENEYPVGCILVHGDRILSHGRRFNSTRGSIIELDHAEIVSLRNLQNKNLDMNMDQVTLYCTMEPCLMCYGTLLLNGVKRIVYAYEDVMGGATGLELAKLSPLYRDMQVEIVPHILRAESLSLQQRFFSDPANNYWKDSLLSQYTLAQS